VVGLPYPVLVYSGALAGVPEVVRRAAPNHRIAIITDSRVESLYATPVAKSLELERSAVFAIPAGERHKTRDTWARLTDEMLAMGFGRDTVIVSIGGAVVGDLAGFVAATYMRGIPVVQVPTTLLAMVDASVGGKTGVDTPAGKNLVGAFHQPAAVVIDPLVLETLPVEHLRAGFAEVVKHGVVADEEYFNRAHAYAERSALDASRGDRDLVEIIERSVEIKASIVSRDEREKGLRKVLNFGHTIGHAIEAATDFATLHGHAVAIGIVAEAHIAERLGIAKSGTARTIQNACHAAGLPTTLPSISVDTIIGFTRADKKARAGEVEYALPKRIGFMAGADRGWSFPVDDKVVRDALSA